jgi:hypothetical protein
MPTENEYKGSCFCGAVELHVTGTPNVMGYCHCTFCRHWSASPVNAFTIWSPNAVIITQGKDQLRWYAKTPNSLRKWCATCGGHVLVEHPKWGVIDVPAAMLPELRFVPAVHVNYASTVLPMRDGLPKQKDFPTEMGGTGTLLPE